MGKLPTLRRPPIVIAHRGASGYLPEHTLAAKAVAHVMGADYLEQDVVLSKDGVPVILHDIHLESTTNVASRFPRRARGDGSFYAIDFELSELRQLRVHERGWSDQGGKHSAYYPGRFPARHGLFQIPTLEEEIALIAGVNQSRGRTAGMYIELKAPDWHHSEGHDIASTVLDVLKQQGLADKPDQIFLQCFDDSTLRRLAGELGTSLPLIQLIGENDWGEDSNADFDAMRTPEGLAAVAEYASGIGPNLPQIYLGRSNDGELLLSELVPQAHEAGLEVHPYTFRRDELPRGITSFDELLELFIDQAQVDGLFTDFPDLVVEFLGRRVNQ